MDVNGRMPMVETTHIRVGEDTADELYRLKSRKDSYDDVIKQLISEHYGRKENRAEA